jgi:hypothetical protein
MDKAVALLGHAEAPLSGRGHAFTGARKKRLIRLDELRDGPFVRTDPIQFLG